MLKAVHKKYTLRFKQPSGTSRGVLTEKTTWFISVFDENNPEITGWGECSFLQGLSIDDRKDFEAMLEKTCNHIQFYAENPELLIEFPAIRFGIETALLDLRRGGKKILFPSLFTRGADSIPINGLVWMGTFDEMWKQIREKINSGFACVKLKIGALDFESELQLLGLIRKEFSPAEIEIRIDANGAFKPGEAFEKLKRLSGFSIHSIEQPIRRGQWEEMARLCHDSPVPIALDEELIGISNRNDRKRLLEGIKPQFIILKPSLIGGFHSTEAWIHLAKEMQTGWWITSALESNIGLNALAQWTYTLRNTTLHGLGTGLLYTNNIESPLTLESGRLYYKPNLQWRFPANLI